MLRHLAIVLLSAPLALGGCATVPATGESAFVLIPESQEIALGNQAAPEFVKDYGGPIPDAQINQYVKALGQRLAEVSERPDLPWEFNVVNAAEINAFALPGGKIFITRGLLAKMNSEAQLAGVLAHEVGHVTALHIRRQMSQALAIQGIGAALGIAGEASDRDYLRVLGMGTQVGGAVYLLSFSREQETEADRLALRYMTRLGYNPVAQIEVMQILQAQGGGGAPEFLSTHPYPETRIENLTRLIRSEYPQYDANPPAYVMKHDAYQANVLSRLNKLAPAPKVHPQQQGGQPGSPLIGRPPRR